MYQPQQPGDKVRKVYIPFLLFVFAILLANIKLASATDGRTAVGKCIDTPGCVYECDASGACLITASNGSVIHCPYPPTSQCFVAGPHRGQGVQGTGAAAPITPGKPINASPPVAGTKPVETNPVDVAPPIRGTKPVNAAPIIRGKPVETSSGPGAKPTAQNHPVLERSGEHSGKH